MATEIERIEVATGPEMERVAKQVATDRGLKQRSHRGHGYGLSPVGPSIGLYDARGVEVVRVTATTYL